MRDRHEAAAARRRERYAPWNQGELFLRQDRVRRSLALLRRLSRTPRPEWRCLEVGCGTGGWLPELVQWGVHQDGLAGLDLDAERLAEAGLRLPAADLRAGDARCLPWPSETFDLVLASTLFSSLLDPADRSRVSAEMIRVLAPGGIVLWYDIRYPSPANRRVVGLGRRELCRLFPGFHGPLRSAGLIPPLARRVAPISPTLCSLLSAVPALRSHLIGCLVRQLP